MIDVALRFLAVAPLLLLAGLVVGLVIGSLAVDEDVAEDNDDAEPGPYDYDGCTRRNGGGR